MSSNSEGQLSTNPVSQTSEGVDFCKTDAQNIQCNVHLPASPVDRAEAQSPDGLMSSKNAGQASTDTVNLNSESIDISQSDAAKNLQCFNSQLPASPADRAKVPSPVPPMSSSNKVDQPSTIPANPNSGRMGFCKSNAPNVQSSKSNAPNVQSIPETLSAVTLMSSNNARQSSTKPPININHNYTTVQIEQADVINIHHNYGIIKVEQCNTIHINQNYGTIKVEQCNATDLVQNYGTIKVEQSDKININHNYGTIKVEQCNKINGAQNYGDIHVEQCDNINIVENYGTIHDEDSDDESGRDRSRSRERTGTSRQRHQQNLVVRGTNLTFRQLRDNLRNRRPH